MCSCDFGVYFLVLFVICVCVCVCVCLDPLKINLLPKRFRVIIKGAEMIKREVKKQIETVKEKLFCAACESKLRVRFLSGG